MRILVINPNTSEEMTRDIGEEARRYARPDTEIEAISPYWGPRSIEAVEADVGVPVLDGFACAVKLLEGIVDYGLATSRVAAYKQPEPKETVAYPPAETAVPR